MKYNIYKRIYLLFVRSKNKTCYLNTQHNQCSINSYQLRKRTRLKEILRTYSSLCGGGGSIDFVVPYLGAAIITFPKTFQKNEQARNKSYCDIKPFSINNGWPGQGNNGVSNLFTLCSQHLFTATLVSDAALLVLFSHGLIKVLSLELNVLFWWYMYFPII